MAAVPLEDQSPLPVHADRMPAVEMAAQLLEMIARRRPQILVASRVVDHLEPAEQAIFKVGRNVSRTGVENEEGALPIVPKADNHPTPQS